MTAQNVKSDVIKFFNKKEYLDHQNRPHQIKIIQALTAKLGEIKIGSEDRNYNHDIDFQIHFDQHANLIAIDLYSGDILNYTSRTKAPLYKAIIKISDIGPFIMIFWNICEYQNDKVEISYLNYEKIPPLLQFETHKILNTLSIKDEIWILSQEEFDLKLHWLSEMPEFTKIEYTPTLGEYLFGGLDLYNQLGI